MEVLHITYVTKSITELILRYCSYLITNTKPAHLCPRRNTKSQGEHVWIEPVSKGEFDVALGARVISKEAGGRIQVLLFSVLIKPAR